MDFRPLNDVERQLLIASLRGNAEGDRAILIDRRDTSFAGSTEEVPDEEVIRRLADHFQLGRLREGARTRF